ncbi:MAG: dihydroxyacetone kinase subunit DhaL [Chloroflexota bacterium]
MVVRWLEGYARELVENKDYLTQLDGEIGDNDHGINMDRGFRAVAAVLPDKAGASIEVLLKLAGMTLIKTVGGASGPLYGTVFLRMGTAAAGKASLTARELGELLVAGQKGIVDRGQAEVGDATMLDAWDAATRAYRDVLEACKDLPDALNVATVAAKQGMESTIPMVARKGRASYLGERGVGHQDPGATSSYLLFKTLRDAVRT